MAKHHCDSPYICLLLLNYRTLRFTTEEKEEMQRKGKIINIILRRIKKANFRGVNELALKEITEIKIFPNCKNL